MAKCGILCPETLLLTEKQLHAIQFFIATRNVCPLAIPKSCAQNMSIRLLNINNGTTGFLCPRFKSLLKQRWKYYVNEFLVGDCLSSVTIQSSVERLLVHSQTCLKSIPIKRTLANFPSSYFHRLHIYKTVNSGNLVISLGLLPFSHKVLNI